MPDVKERKEARLRKTGGSRSIVLPLAWLNEMRVTDRVAMMYQDGKIIIETPQQDMDLEDRPEFALFLDTLLKSALMHPDQLRNAADVMAGDDELFAGVDTDDM